MRAGDSADEGQHTNKTARRMCPLLQVLWLFHWDFVLCRKMTSLSEFQHFGRGTKSEVALAAKLGSNAVPLGWREGTESRDHRDPQGF